MKVSKGALWKIFLFRFIPFPSSNQDNHFSGFVDRSPVSDTEEPAQAVPLFPCSPLPPNPSIAYDPFQASSSFEKVSTVWIIVQYEHVFL